MAQRSWRRMGLTGAVVAALATSILTVPAVQAAPISGDPNLLLHYDFSTAGAVTDVSGNGNDGTLVGTGATFTDGALNLPGGAANSSAGYVRFPASLFDGKDTLTISTWLRNETAAGNYAAMFFGSGATSTPRQYWLLNPRNPQGRFKTVVTNGNDAASPWTTEYGVSPSNAAQGVAGPTTGTSWGMYTTVITPTSISGYYNGSLVGEVPTARTVSQFGTGLVGYIGRSSYADPLYKGGVDDVIVSTSRYTPAQVAELYYGNDRVAAAQTLAALNADADAVSLPTETIADLQLPATGANFSTISWASSDASVIGTDGRVNRPGAGADDAAVTLTATLTLGTQSITRTYPVTVAAVSPQRDLDRTASAFNLGITVVTDNIGLRTSVDNVAISWASSNSGVLAADGTVTRPTTDTEVELTATFALDGRTAVRTYSLLVKAQDAGRVVSYVRSGDTAKTEVLHLAAGAQGDPLVALNNNKGILYPTFGTGTSRFANPTLFRHPDGSYGMVASDNASNGRIFVYNSQDLITFTDQKWALTNTQGITVSRADVTYDNANLNYRVVLRTPAGAAYEVTTADFTTFTAPVARTVPAAPTVTGLPSGAIEASALGVTAAELGALQRSLGRIVNTTVDAGDDIEIEAGAELALPKKVDLGYSDGSSKQLGVEWDTSKVDLATPGKYTVTGTVNQPVYGDAQGILVKERADPWVFRDDERTGDTEYYLTGSYPTTQAKPGVGYDRIVLRRAETINGLTSAKEEVLMWSRNAASPDTSNGSKVATGAYRYFWAPELHKIGGDWYIFFTSSRSTDVWNIRPAIMRAPGDSDPMVASNWQELGYIKAAAGDTVAFTNFSLDMTHFEANGKDYLLWAEKPGTSDLRMAEIDPANPSQLTSKSVLLSTPNFAWERDGGNVINEGAAVIKSDKEVFVFFSASSVNETYAIGMLRAPLGADLMDPATWKKTSYPLLTSEDFGGAQNGPGHNSFTLDENGNPVIVYHARPPVSEWIPGADGGLNDPSRHARVKTVHFAADGSAVLNQTKEEELAPANRTVTLTVTVTGPPAPALDVSTVVSARCVAGKVVQTVTIKNGASVPVALSVAGTYGTKAIESLAAGKSTSATFTTRLANIPAGTVSVTASATVGGAPVTVTDAVTYAVATCG